MVDPELIEMLCCPETKMDVKLEEGPLIQTLNQKIEAGELTNRGGTKVTEKMDAGLVREDKQYLYPIREDIPIMLIDEAIPLEGLI